MSVLQTEKSDKVPRATRWHLVILTLYLAPVRQPVRGTQRQKERERADKVIGESRDSTRAKRSLLDHGGKRASRLDWGPTAPTESWLSVAGEVAAAAAAAASSSSSSDSSTRGRHIDAAQQAISAAEDLVTASLPCDLPMVSQATSDPP